MQPYENGKKKKSKDRIKWQALNKTRLEWNDSYALISYLSNKYGNFSNYTMHTLSKHDAPHSVAQRKIEMKKEIVQYLSRSNL